MGLGWGRVLGSGVGRGFEVEVMRSRWAESMCRNDPTLEEGVYDVREDGGPTWSK